MTIVGIAANVLVEGGVHLGDVQERASALVIAAFDQAIKSIHGTLPPFPASQNNG